MQYQDGSERRFEDLLVDAVRGADVEIRGSVGHRRLSNRAKRV
jgi:hypothetical protein